MPTRGPTPSGVHGDTRSSAEARGPQGKRTFLSPLRARQHDIETDQVNAAGDRTAHHLGRRSRGDGSPSLGHWGLPEPRKEQTRKRRTGSNVTHGGSLSGVRTVCRSCKPTNCRSSKKA